MDRIKDAQVIGLIERIGSHYRANISNRFLRPILLTLQLDKLTWDQVEFLTEKEEVFRYQGFHLDELYRQIVACARLVESARSGIAPTIKSRLNAVPAGSDKILRDMAANNFASNLQVFADMLNELYLNLTEIDDKSAGNNKPVYTQMPELSGIERLLTGR